MPDSYCYNCFSNRGSSNQCLYGMGTKGRILKKDQWANFKADGVVVLGCAVRPNKEASPMLNDRMQTAISFYKEASAKKMLVSGDNLNEDYDEVSVMKKTCSVRRN